MSRSDTTFCVSSGAAEGFVSVDELRACLKKDTQVGFVTLNLCQLHDATITGPSAFVRGSSVRGHVGESVDSIRRLSDFSYVLELVVFLPLSSVPSLP